MHTQQQHRQVYYHCHRLHYRHLNQQQQQQQQQHPPQHQQSLQLQEGVGLRKRLQAAGLGASCCSISSSMMKLSIMRQLWLKTVEL